MTILEDIIERTGKSKRDIATEIGCTHMTVYNWMRNPKTMSVTQIEKFAKAVRRSPRNIFSLIINN